MKSRALSIELRTTALAVLDLQEAIVSLPLAPYAGKQVVTRCAHLAQSFRAAGSTIILVRLGFSVDGRDRLAPAVHIPLVRRPTPAVRNPDSPRSATAAHLPYRRSGLHAITCLVGQTTK